MKIETYLPIFPGFSGTWFECDKEELLIEEGKNYDDYSWNYAKYYQDAAAVITDIIGDWTKEELNVNIKHQKIVSPRYYNYQNDWVNIECTLSADAYSNIIIYLAQHKDKFSTYLRERYTSYDGFISSYSNNFTDWMNYLGNEEKLHHVFGTVLDFILNNEGYNKDELYGAFCEQEIELLATLMEE